MTKAKAISMLKENSRYLIEPEFASKIAKAFNVTLKDLGLQPDKVKNFGRLVYTDEAANLQAIATYQLAESLCYKLTGEEVTSSMYGRGSYARDITEKAIAKLQTS